jgi:hypothetical protein
MLWGGEAPGPSAMCSWQQWRISWVLKGGKAPKRGLRVRDCCWWLQILFSFCKRAGHPSKPFIFPSWGEKLSCLGCKMLVRKCFLETQTVHAQRFGCREETGVIHCICPGLLPTHVIAWLQGYCALSFSFLLPLVVPISLPG